MEKEQRNRKKLLDADSSKTDSTKSVSAQPSDSSRVSAPKATSVETKPEGSVQDRLMHENSKRGELFRKAMKSKESQPRPAPKKENAPKAWGKNPESQEIVNAIAKGGSISEETFKKMKGICLKIVEGKEFYSFSKFKPAEYKYFTELVELYQKYVGKAISKEDAEEKERKLHREYEEDKANEQKYFEFIKQWNNAIRVTEMNRASINKCEDKDIALDLALQCIAMMTGDTPFLGFARDKFLKDKPHAVSYDISADLIEPEQQPEAKKEGDE